MLYRYFGYETKLGIVCILVIFQDRPSATSYERSRRELSIDAADNVSIGSP